MGSNGSLISPLLVKKQPVRILAIRMDMVRETARFGARPGAMLGAQGDDVRASVSRDSKRGRNDNHNFNVARVVLFDMK